MKREILILAGLWFSTAAVLKADDSSRLVFMKADGSVVTVAAKRIEMSFSDGKLLVNDGTDSYELSLADLKSMYFKTDGTTGVDDVSDAASYENAEVQVYAMSGVHVGKYATMSDFTQNASPGIYVVKSKGKTFKTVVK